MKPIQESFIIRLKELAGIVSEAKSQETYFDTLNQALEFIQEKTKKEGFDIVDSQREFFLFGVGGIEYGETKRGSFYLSKNGEPVKKKLHIQIYRMDSGRYELNQYIA